MVDSVVRVAAAAAGALVLARALRRPQSDRKCVVVDAGSGSTRATLFGSLSNGRVVVLKGPERVDARVADALADAGKTDAFVGDVSKAVRAMAAGQYRGKLPVYMGATAGGRESLRSAETGAEARVKKAMAEQVHDRAIFKVLSEGAEADCELRAVKYVGGQHLGLLSGGGKSMQLATDSHLRSISLDSFKGRLLVEKKGAAGAAMHDWECRRKITNTLLGDCRTPRFGGEFGVIELAAGTLRRAMDGDFVPVAKTQSWLVSTGLVAEAAAEPAPRLSVADAIELLEKRKAYLMRDGTFKNAQAITYIIQMLAILEIAFHDDAILHLLDDGETSPKPAWPLGLYLKWREALY
ncbi:hypothetical protein M885DRAFT_620281 [Pelagophyceae sp. CCMP2097]|nr:hypothetical protein M885DRAFT_620281 [Pelagophyceae sp. CCMP2097]|mmetsp:Transcript_28828/g.99331  ORF Transcript_28828/g.99331 Transcript_28828/m.99331 type:complete len:352 (-) Transcript_28828:30-1085(-)